MEQMWNDAVCAAHVVNGAKEIIKLNYQQQKQQQYSE